MQSTTESYNPYTDERWSASEVVFELIDVDAADNATPSATSEAEISKLSQSHNKMTSMSKKIATMEPDYFLLDGSFILPDEHYNEEVGWWSAELSDSNGVFVTPQVLEFAFDADQSSNGFTVIFDNKANEYATDFIIETFDQNDAIVSQKNVTGNTNPSHVADLPSDGYRKVKVTFYKTHKPFRRVRVCEFVFGFLQFFYDDDITGLDLLHEMSPTSENLPSNQLTLTLKNTDRQYNIINPTGIYKFLQQGQGLNVRLGIGESRDEPEMINMGRYYFESVTAADNSMTAQIVAYDKLYALDRGLYRKGQNTVGTVLGIVTDIIEDSGLSLAINIPSNIANRVIGRNIPIVSHREALRMVAQAAMSSCYIDRSERLVFVEMSDIAPIDILDKSNMYRPVSVAVSEYVNMIEISYYHYIAKGSSELYNGVIAINGSKEIWIDYGPAQSVAPRITGGTITASEYYLHSCKLHITAASDVTLKLNGTNLELTETPYRTAAPIGELEFLKQIQNTLVTSAYAEDFANWCLMMEQKRLSYTAEERGNIAREIGDTAKIFDAYNENRNAIITKEQFAYDGTLRCSTQAIGGGF